MKRRKEIQKWKTEKKVAAGEGAMQKTSPLLAAALNITKKGNLNRSSSQSQSRRTTTDSPTCRNSLLSHRKSLIHVVEQTPITFYATAPASTNLSTNEQPDKMQTATKRPAQEFGTPAKKARHSIFSPES
ncbi:unnamed protein product [Gongylonema pulchrum]|uniref:Uncharacterized protein n=1 Tax=Gongylonema pulchrum TaxID=637853 RepID=A0A3P7MV28_9BILA|nr:unnamed protein product [Gongylonema pulchrum]